MRTEIFYRTEAENREYEVLDGDGEPMPEGFYWWYCFAGCLPECEPMGPFRTVEAAQRDIDSQDDYCEGVTV